MAKDSSGSYGPIIVLNPNSNEAVTNGLDEALETFRFPGSPPIECLTLAEGPFGLETQIHSDQVVMPMVRLVEERRDASAFVIACYSDPGIDACRSVSNVPVFGMQECGTLTAMARGDQFGVIAITNVSVLRHRKYMRRMGVLDRLAAERPLDMSVDETARGENTYSRLVEVGRQLLDDGANSIVLGCAGMARHRAPLEAELGVPVIEPTQAAVAMALGAVLAGN
ncbi:MAG: aspartate/glutamate racemase family protein [Hyphomicrobiaceae bacterium]